MPKTKAIQITGAHRLMLDSWRFMRANFRQLLGVLVVAEAVNLIINFALGSEVAGLYQSLWFVFISCALIWAIRHAEDKQVKVTLAKAYYVGTAPVLRFFLVLITVTLATLPFSVGAFIYSVVAAATSGSGLVEKLVAGGLWAALALVTLILLARLAFSLLIVTLPDVRPLQSIKLSWQLSRGKTNALVLRLGIFSVYLGLIGIATLLGLSYLPISPGLADISLSLLGTLLVLPLVYIYLYQLYRAAK